MVTTFMDFRPFFNAMIKKMREKDPEYGDTWKELDRVYYKDGTPANPTTDEEIGECYTVTMEDHLDNLLRWETEAYQLEPNFDKLVNMANYEAMRWLRHHIRLRAGGSTHD